MSNVRDELQRWVEGGSWADQGAESSLTVVARELSMSGDPAVEAAQRAAVSDGRLAADYYADEVLAAREALAPLRALHKRGECPDWTDCTDPDHLNFCRSCVVLFPCPTARLIYPEDEL